MKVGMTQDVLHGGFRYQDGLAYAVPDDVGAYFVHLGWAEELPADAKAHVVEDAPPAPQGPQRKTLQVQNAVVGHKTEVK